MFGLGVSSSRGAEETESFLGGFHIASMSKKYTLVIS